MGKLKNLIDKLSKVQKIISLILILSLILLLSIGIPSLARFKNRVIIDATSVWDGSIASSYKDGKGTELDPYVISNGSELAYFQTQLQGNDYDNNYFVLSNDIVLNSGIFNYDHTDGIQYIYNDITYYVDEYTNKYYDNVDRDGTEVGTLNVFSSLNGFKGHFDGKSFRIYGVYITDENSEQLALFTNLEGDVHNLYVENAFVYGGIVTGGIASTSNNVSLSNILFDGYVVGKSTLVDKNTSVNSTASIINVENSETTNYINTINDIPFVGSEIISTSITGNYIINGATEAETTITINGITISGGSFSVDLGTDILDSVPVLTSTTVEGDVTLTFSNLNYNINYKYAVSGGIVGISNNVVIENVINKAFIYGYSVSGGLVGVTTDILNINQSYNVGNIDSQYVSGGLVGVVEKSENDINILKSYNTGDITANDIGGLIGILKNNTGTVSINNVFNTSTTNFSIGTITSTTVNVSNAYYVNGVKAIYKGAVNGSFTTTTLVNLQTKNYVINNLDFNEFIDFNDLQTNSQNIWIYEKDSLPISFVDDLNNPIANIHASVYTWNNLSYELKSVKLNSNITFSIEEVDELNPFKEVYYYINNSSVPLTSAEISNISTWNPYSDIVRITTEGFYVVYAKVVDYDDNVTYLNTDLLVLDFSGSSVSISLDDKAWTDLRENLNYEYIDRPKSIVVDASDNLSGVASVKYYITDQIFNGESLDALDSSNWSTYSTPITVSQIGTYIIYVQVIDNCDSITYANSDFIVLNGYTTNFLRVGRNESSYVDAKPYITNKSTITFNYSYLNSSATPLTDHTHNLMSNLLLPLNTKIILIDNVKRKIYEYQISTSEDIYNYNDSCNSKGLECVKTATIPFTLFKEVGTGTTSIPFAESTYYDNGTVSEDYTIILDLSNTDISTNHNDVSLFIELHDSDGNNVRPTLYDTIETFNIYSMVDSSNSGANLYITTDYNNGPIMYNSDSTTNINITSGVSYKYIGEHRIIDTTYEDKEMGLAIRLVDINGNVIDKKYLKNVIFRMGTNEYYPEDDNIVRINLENGIADVTKTISIITYDDNIQLGAGTYYFKISSYASFDGRYHNNFDNAELSIPISVLDNVLNIKYSFNVEMNDTNRIINKSEAGVNVTFDILQRGPLKKPNIRVALYKKNQLTAYNQDYTLVDLATHVSDVLNNCSGYVYYVTTNPVRDNPFQLNLITNTFENNGYKFVFELYDDQKKIGAIEKHFIVK